MQQNLVVKNSFVDILKRLEPGNEYDLREGLHDTPARMVRAWEYWTSGYAEKLEDIVTDFKDGGEHYNQMVPVVNIPIYSHCEHHLAPFFGLAHVGYFPDRRILGLSKFVRIVNMFARRLQVQERLTNQIAEAIQQVTNSHGVAVVMDCRHLCMESRGVHSYGTITPSSAMLGTMLDNYPARAEFLAHIDRNRKPL